ncbi:uncharacterized protein LOC130892311 [Diorhabda carinulata]|uniref:uncharacterized protein LOC130892311 n=1 Tax=Diorhabda carinulata TaxID=1163345 RepID=UPI0025A062EB|nr:uncharacterized protein LOC130892311 [Diorhabda carinulata]
MVFKVKYACLAIFQVIIISDATTTIFNNDTELIQELEVSGNRSGRFFGVGLVRFANSGCTSGSLLLGTCLRKRQCSDISGTASGSCASGIGVCCVIIRSCGDTSAYNSTYFTNTNYPASITTSTRCVMTIEKASSDICQVRIDFLNFILSQPNATGVCTTDALYVTGGAGLVPVLCGDNTGQHIYVDFNGNENIQLIVTTSGSGFSRSWNFLVTQIACACPTRAPSGCLQFYNTTTGTVNSFNYGVGSNIINSNTGLPGTRELVNENYGVCINMLPGYCSIQWSSNGFIVTGIPGSGYDNLIGTSCTTDFVIIPNPYYTNGTAVNSDRFCGTSLTTVISSLKPFVLYVVTDGTEGTTGSDDVANTGFSLTFTQLACANTLF